MKQQSKHSTTIAKSPPKIALVWIDFVGYHLARLRAIQNQLEGNCVGIELVGGFGDQDCCGLPFRDSDREGLNIITLFPDKDLNQLSTLQLSQKLVQTLQELKPEYVALCGYHRLENLAALAWAKVTGRSAILMIESKQNDARRRSLQEWLKGVLVKQFDRYLVGGTSHRQYMTMLGAPNSHVFEGYDVVDNLLFAEAAKAAQQNQQILRKKINLPDRYFLAACRFVPKKNLVTLLEAYRLYRQITDTRWSLVICGGGPLEAELRQFVEVRGIPDVYLPGFHKGKELGTYYGLASCFIHPSLQEQWGLTVNEAMAAGLPILVSRTCGCVPDLVQEGINGFTFDPTDSSELAELMSKIAHDNDSLASMGSASQAIIQKYAPEAFAINLVLAMKAS
jgi:glycosyltransferase involved in cell wall biosynthesis